MVQLKNHNAIAQARAKMGFNSTMVQLKSGQIAQIFSAEQGFNSTMVQLKMSQVLALQEDLDKVSIPQWFN